MIGLEQMTPAGQENTEPVVMPDDEVLYELAGPVPGVRRLHPASRSYMRCMTMSSACRTLPNAVQLSQSAVSHQLRVLKDTKLVRFRRDGKTVYYALDDDHVRSILSMGMDHIEE